MLQAARVQLNLFRFEVLVGEWVLIPGIAREAICVSNSFASMAYAQDWDWTGLSKTACGKASYPPFCSAPVSVCSETALYSLWPAAASRPRG